MRTVIASMILEKSTSKFRPAGVPEDNRIDKWCPSADQAFRCFWRGGKVKNAPHQLPKIGKQLLKAPFF